MERLMSTIAGYHETIGWKIGIKRLQVKRKREYNNIK